MKRGYVDVPEGQIHYRYAGSGPVVLLLHQSLSTSAELNKIGDIMGDEFAVYAPDMMGWGGSDPLPFGPTIADYVRCTLHFMDALGLQSAYVAGHHTGALVALELATQHPARVRKLMLSGCPSWNKAEGEAQLADVRFQPVEYVPEGTHLLKVWGAAVAGLGREYFGFGTPTCGTLQLAHEYFLDWVTPGPRSEDPHRAAFRYDAVAKLPMVTQPTLVVCGDQDLLFPFHARTRELVPNCVSEVIAGGDAFITRLMPREWAAAALKFFTAATTA
jgi:pimeloyl-ACP methyl ester carboxylesterase